MKIDPRLGDDHQSQHRYHAARAAALAAAGEGRDEPPLDDAEKAKLRRQALDWLKAELTVCAGFRIRRTQARLNIALALYDWQKAPDSLVSATPWLWPLPKDEQKAFTRLWADVAELLTKAGSGFRALPAAQQFEEVREELKKRNPGLTREWNTLSKTIKSSVDCASAGSGIFGPFGLLGGPQRLRLKARK